MRVTIIHTYDPLIETIWAIEVQNRLDEMLEMAHYQNKVFTITCLYLP